MKTTTLRSLATALLVASSLLSTALADTATPSPFTRTIQRAIVPVAIPTASPTSNAVLLRATLPRQRALTVPQAPTGMRQALIGDCDGRADVRAATGGSGDACKFRFDHGAVVFYWDAYHEDGCPSATDCPIGGWDIVNFRTKSSVAKVSDQSVTAAEISPAQLGDCFVVRAMRALESSDSRPHCVLVVRATKATLVGPTEIGQFRALVHDNADSSYCTRRSWDSTWALEPWGFSTAIQSMKEPAGNTGAGISLTVGHLAQEHPGTQPFPCPESLAQIWRGVLDFDVPADARSNDASIRFTFTPAGVSSDFTNCFQYLWNPHRWFINEHGDGHYTAPLIGEINNKVLDHDDDPIGTLTLASGRASYDFGVDRTILNRGHLALELSQFEDGLSSSDLGNPRLHSGNYLSGTSSAFCGARNPRLEVTYVNVQTTAQPVLPQFDQSIQQKAIPHVFGTSAPN